MRRVFPLRPSENWTYNAEDLPEKKLLPAFVRGDEQPFRCMDDGNSIRDDAVDKSSRLMRRDAAARSTGSEANCENLPIPARSKHREIVGNHKLPPRAAAYPVFTGGTSRWHRSSPHASLDKGREEMQKYAHESSRVASCASMAPSSPSSSAGRHLKESSTYAKPFSKTEERPSSSVPKVRPCVESSSPKSGNLRASSMRLLRLPDSVVDGAGEQEQLPPKVNSVVLGGRYAMPVFHSRSLSHQATVESSPRNHGHSRIPSFAESTSDASSYFTETTGSTSSRYSSSLASDSSVTRKGSASGRSASSKSPFKYYLSARMVAEKLVKALRKERICAQMTKSNNASATDVYEDVPSRTDKGDCKAEIGSGRQNKDVRGRSSDASHLTEEQWLSMTGARKCESLGSFRFQDDYKDSCRSRIETCFESQKPSQKHDAGICQALEARALAREQQAALLDKENELLLDDELNNIVADDGGEHRVSEVEYLDDAAAQKFHVLRQEIRRLRGEKRELALEVASEIWTRISEHQSADETLRRSKEEMECQVMVVEREKANIQESLEKELERRSAEWTTKLEKIKVEERRLRERVGEIAEEKVGLQKEVASLTFKEAALRAQVKESQFSFDTLKQRAEETEKEMMGLKQTLADACRESKATDDNLEALVQSCEAKERENSDLQKTLVSLQRHGKEQAKTIQGLWQALDEAVNGGFEARSENIVMLQRELLRLTGVEIALRNELDAFRVELSSLKQENRSLLETLKIAHKDSAVDMVKLDQELRGRMDVLQAQALTLQDENRQLSTKLRTAMREKRDAETTLRLFQLSREGMDHDLQLDPESGRTRAEEKDGEKANAWHSDEERERKQKIQQGEHTVQVNEQLKEDLKEEKLLCMALRGKLYLREVELERLHGEVATLAHSRDRLQTEVDGLDDKLLTSNQRVRELKRQLAGKEKEMNTLQKDLAEHLKEFNQLQEELPRLRSQRDEMRKEAEDMSREAIRLSVEVRDWKMLAEKLEEELMVKEGQLSILRRPFDDCDLSVP